VSSLATTWKPKVLDVFVQEHIRSSSPKISNLIKKNEVLTINSKDDIMNQA
jgi:hypothetical protein